jgi:hypothetical protein
MPNCICCFLFVSTTRKDGLHRTSFRAVVGCEVKTTRKDGLHRTSFRAIAGFEVKTTRKDGLHRTSFRAVAVQLGTDLFQFKSIAFRFMRGSGPDYRRDVLVRV